MINAKEIFEDMFAKIKNMQMYQIQRQVEQGWLPTGTLPFDLHIKNKIATFTVYALSEDDAENQVTQYLENQDQDEQD
jgi:hypothetical protein